MPGGDGRGVEHEDVDAAVAHLDRQAGAKGGHKGLRGRVQRREGRGDGRRGAAREHDAAAQLLGDLIRQRRQAQGGSSRLGSLQRHGDACKHAAAEAGVTLPEADKDQRACMRVLAFALSRAQGGGVGGP